MMTSKYADKIDLRYIIYTKDGIAKLYVNDEDYNNLSDEDKISLLESIFGMSILNSLYLNNLNLNNSFRRFLIGLTLDFGNPGYDDDNKENPVYTITI